MTAPQPRRPGRPDVLNSALAATVARAPDLEADLKAFIREILRDGRRTLRTGNIIERAQLMKTILPGLLKQVADRPVEDVDERAAFDEVMAAVNRSGEIGAGTEMLRLLDLFCGAGGAAMGYHRAGFEVVGVDINPQPNYPFEFHQADALTWPVDGFDAIHASPPCQAHSVLRRANPGAKYLDLIPLTRDRLITSGLPWVIENVPGAPLRDPIVLCGSMFGLEVLAGNGDNIERKVRQLRRHRLFESNFPIAQPRCSHDGEAIGVYGGGPVGRYTFENGAKKDRYGRRGGYQGTVAEKRIAMDIDWMKAGALNQAIPPAYTEHIGRQLIEQGTKTEMGDWGLCRP